MEGWPNDSLYTSASLKHCPLLPPNAVLCVGWTKILVWQSFGGFQVQQNESWAVSRIPINLILILDALLLLLFLHNKHVWHPFMVFQSLPALTWKPPQPSFTSCSALAPKEGIVFFLICRIVVGIWALARAGIIARKMPLLHPGQVKVRSANKGLARHPKAHILPWTRMWWS